MDDMEYPQQELAEVTVKTDWANPPRIGDLRQNFMDAKGLKDDHTVDVDYWLDHLHVQGNAKIQTAKNKSSVQPRVVRKNNEWRYPALSEPFLSTDSLFNVSPYTYEDKDAARQNALVLNHQFNHEVDKTAFIDEYVRTAVDEGTVFVRVGWESMEGERPVTTYKNTPVQSQEDLELFEYYSNKEFVSEHWEEALKLSQQMQQPYIPTKVLSEEETETYLKVNRPTIEVVDFRNLTIDPTCDGNLDKAQFVIFTYDTSLAELEMLGQYENLDDIQIDQASVLGKPDDEFDSNDDSSFSFKDDARKRIVVYEYWGEWDIHNDGTTVPIVVSWVGGTVIRMEENPFPDGKHPFVSAQYMPRRKELYGEPDAELLIDNQKIIGAVSRAMIDMVSKTANGQVGMRKDLLDPVNLRKYKAGQDYFYNPTADPRLAIHEHAFPEIPNSAQFMLEQQKFEAETMTGVRPYGATDSSVTTATAARDAMDAATKRETSILRRLAAGMQKIGQKVVAMNQEFLSDKEIIRITNEKFIEIKREDLAGKFDLVLNISTAEEDNAKAQELAFMLQTIGPSLDDPKIAFDLMADIADLRRLPETAERLRRYSPQPDPVQQAIQQAELEKVQLENMLLQVQIQKTQSEIAMNQAKTGHEAKKIDNVQADTDLKNLEYVQEELGVNHERQMQQDSAQARANLQRDLILKSQESNQPNTPAKS